MYLNVDVKQFRTEIAKHCNANEKVKCEKDYYVFPFSCVYSYYVRRRKRNNAIIQHTSQCRGSLQF